MTTCEEYGHDYQQDESDSTRYVCKDCGESYQVEAGEPEKQS